MYVIEPREADAALLKRWSSMLNSHPIYRSPYYHPEYTFAVAAVRPDLRLLVMEEGSQICGLLPFHQIGGRALTLGEKLTDYQGPIADINWQMPLRLLLRGMKVSYFSFNHMPSERLEFSQHAWQQDRSLQLNLENGFAAYAQCLAQQRNASVLKKVETNRRKLTSKFGELRFEMHSVSQTDFDALLSGKSRQYQRTGGTRSDIFAVRWVRDAVQRLFETRQPGFSGVLSTLFAGERMIAAHFGLRSRQVLHYWFPWYDTAYADYSPGLVLLASCAEGAATQGISVMDLGKGEQSYKQRFATGHQSLCEGAISFPMLAANFQGIYHRWRQIAKSSPLGKRVRGWKLALKSPRPK
jgi:CelD/BcsL family acetyltransferase involved in cellulose biosynthesis